MYNSTDDSQLWKFDQDGTTEDGTPKYKMVSKAGRNIEYRYPETVEEVETVTGRFLAVASSNNTFSFHLRTADKGWQLFWNEYETEDSNGIMEVTGSYMNKTNTDTEVTAYAEMPSVGSHLKIYKENEPIDIGLPQFSTDTEEYWYYIQFARVKNKQNVAVLSASEPGELLTQAELDPENELFKWKFVGNMAECLIVDINGNAWGVKSTSIVDASEGDYYKFEGYGIKTWALFNESDTENTQRYVNDFGGTADQVGQWSLDSGSEMVFTSTETVSIDNPVTDEEDPVVSTTYYTIEGLQLGSQLPSVQGIYIEKTTHTSKKVSARKIFIPGR
ncbi:MAG: hypothetical protein LIO93_01505 [Bacteroidales bacterium]|nr:hypothetical protein [Bacteroidales bacterium]